MAVAQARRMEFHPRQVSGLKRTTPTLTGHVVLTQQFTVKTKLTPGTPLPGQDEHNHPFGPDGWSFKSGVGILPNGSAHDPQVVSSRASNREADKLWQELDSGQGEREDTAVTRRHQNGMTEPLGNHRLVVGDPETTSTASETSTAGGSDSSHGNGEHVNGVVSGLQEREGMGEKAGAADTSVMSLWNDAKWRAAGESSDGSSSQDSVFEGLTWQKGKTSGTWDEADDEGMQDRIWEELEQRTRVFGRGAQSHEEGQGREAGKMAGQPGGDTWHVVEFGRPGTLGYRMLYFDDGKGREISPWHNLSLYGPDGLLNFVCCTPIGSWVQYEVAQEEDFTPLRIKKVRGKPGHYAENCPWNYGFLPQTWADEEMENVDYGGLTYDGLPLEVIEIGSSAAQTGDVYPVKPLAAFAVIDNCTQLSWKIVAIAAADVMAPRLSGVNELNQFVPGALEEVRGWLQTRNCVEAEDKESTFGLNQRAANHGMAMELIAQMHSAWQLLTDQGGRPEDSWQAHTQRPATAAEYEDRWRRYTERESDERIALREASLESALRYDRAWAVASEEGGLGAEGEELPDASNLTPPSGAGEPGASHRRRELLSFLRPHSHKTAGNVFQKLKLATKRGEGKGEWGEGGKGEGEGPGGGEQSFGMSLLKGLRQHTKFLGARRGGEKGQPANGMPGRLPLTVRSLDEAKLRELVRMQEEVKLWGWAEKGETTVLPLTRSKSETATTAGEVRGWKRDDGLPLGGEEGPPAEWGLEGQRGPKGEKPARSPRKKSPTGESHLATDGHPSVGAQEGVHPRKEKAPARTHGSSPEDCTMLPAISSSRRCAPAQQERAAAWVMQNQASHSAERNMLDGTEVAVQPTPVPSGGGVPKLRPKLSIVVEEPPDDEPESEDEVATERSVSARPSPSSSRARNGIPESRHFGKPPLSPLTALKADVQEELSPAPAGPLGMRGPTPPGGRPQPHTHNGGAAQGQGGREASPRSTKSMSMSRRRNAQNGGGGGGGGTDPSALGLPLSPTYHLPLSPLSEASQFPGNAQMISRSRSLDSSSRGGSGGSRWTQQLTSLQGPERQSSHQQRLPQQRHLSLPANFQLPKVGSSWVVQAAPAVMAVGGVASGSSRAVEEEEETEDGAILLAQVVQVQPPPDVTKVYPVGAAWGPWDEPLTPKQDLEGRPIRALGRRVSFSEEDEVFSFQRLETG